MNRLLFFNFGGFSTYKTQVHKEMLAYSQGKIFSLVRKIFLTEIFFLHFFFIILHFIHGKPLKIEKSNLFIYFSLFFSMLKFFSCRLNKFFPGSFGRKRIGSGTLWNFSWPAATRNSKIGFPRQFFLPYEPVKNFSHGKKKFSHWQKRKINEQSTNILLCYISNTKKRNCLNEIEQSLLYVAK